MARLPKGMLGEVQGKVGPVVGCTWKGKAYVRALPKKRTGKPSEGSLRSQSDFSVMHYWLQPILPVLREGFKDFSETNFGYNAAKTMLSQRGLVRDGMNSYVDPAQVLVSYGDLPLSENLQTELQGQEVVFSWNPEAGTEKNPRDQVMLLAYDPVSKEKSYVVNGNFRKNGSDSLELSAPGTYHLYAAFLAHDRSRQSESRYLGSVEYGN